MSNDSSSYKTTEHEDMILSAITDEIILDLCFEMHYAVSSRISPHFGQALTLQCSHYCLTRNSNYLLIKSNSPSLTDHSIGEMWGHDS